MDIDELRGRVDEIDERLVGLLSERAKVVCEIKRYKDENGLDVLDENREKRIFDGVRDLAREHGLDEDFVEKIFGDIIAESKRVQGSIF